MYSVIFQFDVLPERREDFRAISRTYAEECLRDEPGTRGFRFVQDESNENRFYVFESYADLDAVQAHMQAGVLQRIGPQIGPMLAGAPVQIGRGFEFYP
jgi:autoinducer 2-degrading protein